MTANSSLSQIIILLAGYCLGSLPNGFLAGKWISGVDLREIGSGSTGATNVFRHVGKRAAFVVFVLDVGKGVLAVLLAKAFMAEEMIQVAAGLAALIGHIWPIWLRGKGGKAVATGLGILLGISWEVGLASLGIFITVLVFSRIVSLSSIASAISLPMLMSIHFQGDNFRPAYLIVALLATSMILWRHRSNLKRLRIGNEPRIGRN